MYNKDLSDDRIEELTKEAQSIEIKRLRLNRDKEKTESNIKKQERDLNRQREELQIKTHQLKKNVQEFENTIRGAKFKSYDFSDPSISHSSDLPKSHRIVSENDYNELQRLFYIFLLIPQATNLQWNPAKA